MFVLARHRLSRVPILATCALLLVGCTGAATGPTVGSVVPTASSVPSMAVSSPSPQPAWTPAPPAPSPSSSPDASSLRLVGLGDSVAGAGHCGGCRSYVIVYGELASKALGTPVIAKNLARNDGLESGRLLDIVRTWPDVREALAAADIVTVGIGWNDWQGPCTWLDHESCLTRGQKGVEKNLAATLDEIARLRDGKPTAIRVVTYANPYLGDPQTPEYWGVPRGPTNDKMVNTYFVTALDGFDAMLCQVAAAHGATCADVVPAFNGPDGTNAMREELRESQAQMDLIAKVIDDVGYAPLQ